MSFPTEYKILGQKKIQIKNISIVPIRLEDRFEIMKWRNEQMYHLRQNKLLNEKDQNNYFKNVIINLFDQKEPNQILFSYLENGKCIGYGGLVHINWSDKNAEISFIMNTELENDYFESHWITFLSLIEKLAFEELKFHKIYTYALDLRPKLYKALEYSSFKKEAVLNKHCLFDGKFINVVIHSKYKKNNNVLLENKKYGNVLITSISKKVPLIQCVKKALSKLDENIKIIGGDTDKKAIGKYFLDEFWKMPMISKINISEFIQVCKQKNISVIIPTRDGDLDFFSRNKDILKSKEIHVMISDFNSINKCFDKLKFSNNDDNFQKLFIPTFDNIENNLNKRFVVKERFGAGSLSIGINLSKEKALEHSLLLENPVFQPYIEGFEISIDAYIDLNNQIKGIVLRKREIVVNGESQVTTIIEDITLEKEFKSILRYLNLYGHVMLQAIIDSKNKIHIIECNPRFGGASTLAIRAGLDSFYWVYLESLKLSIEDHHFKKSDEEITQVRYSKDLYI